MSKRSEFAGIIMYVQIERPMTKSDGQDEIPYDFDLFKPRYVL